MDIADNCVVVIRYKLTDDTGEELDPPAGREPVTYVQGVNGIIPGLESALTGKSVGDRLQVTVQPEDAYGPVDPKLIDIVPKSAFEGLDDVQPGMQFRAEGPKGEARLISVREVSDEGVTVDANHPLAGHVLHFDVTVEAVREATDEELSHGYVR